MKSAIRILNLKILKIPHSLKHSLAAKIERLLIKSNGLTPFISYSKTLKTLTLLKIISPPTLEGLSNYFWANGPLHLATAPTLILLKTKKNPPLLFRAAELSGLEGKSEKRTEFLNQARLCIPSNSEDFLFIGLACLRLQMWEDAASAFSTGLNEGINSNFYWASLIKCSIESKRINHLIETIDHHNPSHQILNEAFSQISLEELMVARQLARTSRQESKISSLTPHIIDRIISAKDWKITIKYASLAAAYCDIDFRDSILDRQTREVITTNEKEAKKWLFRINLYKSMAIPYAFEEEIDDEKITRTLIKSYNQLAQNFVELDEPISDLGPWTKPWEAIYCRAVPNLYSNFSISLEELCTKVWPKLLFESPHISKRIANKSKEQRIRIGFIAADFIPMISGIMGKLDSNIFERIYIHPSDNGAKTENSEIWSSRAEKTIQIPTDNVYKIQQIISNLELDIIITAPAGPALIYPLISRLACLQMILIEPNWTDGWQSYDYYISWQKAEPQNFRNFHKSSVALLKHPPYWIEPPPQKNASQHSSEQFLTPKGKRLYLCPTLPTKLHSKVDQLFLKLLELDKDAELILLRMDTHAAETIKTRLRKSVEPHFHRITFLPTLKKEEVSSLLRQVDCVLDSHPLGGMSSSFAAAVQGTPTITLPCEFPFGKWMAAIHEYLQISDLTANSPEDFAEKALRLARDRDFKKQKEIEVASKAVTLIENENSFEDLQEFLINAMTRYLDGHATADWMSGAWHERDMTH